MTKSPAGNDTKKTKGGITILGVLILSAVAIAGGTGFGLMAPGLMQAAPAGKKAAVPPVAETGLPRTAILEPLGPITTNLAQPSSTWIRLESSLVIDTTLGPEGDIEAKKIAEDIVSFLRTVSVEQIQGPAGFQHLREDLNDRARIRSKGRVSDLIIQSLIIE